MNRFAGSSPAAVLVAGMAVAGVALAGGAAVAGCSSKPGATAVLDVGIRYAGGPGGPGAPSPAPLQPGSITVTVGGKAVAAGTSTEGNRARLTVAPGTYQVVAVSGDAGCAPQSAVATAATTTEVTVICDVK